MMQSSKTQSSISDKAPIVQKAYEINLNRLNDGFLFDNIICYADSLNAAKRELLKKTAHDDLSIRYTGHELTYLNIPVIRRKQSDKVIFEDRTTFRCKIDDILEERKRKAKLDEILNNPAIIYCYIIKGSYYRPNSCGYTSHKEEAGVYVKEEAVAHAKSVREIRLERVDIEEHNTMINEKIADLRGRLL